MRSYRKLAEVQFKMQANQGMQPTGSRDAVPAADPDRLACKVWNQSMVLDTMSS